MERFGDDLTEVILQNLSIKDKIRLECVSKQWQRCIFEKQFEFESHFDGKIKPNLLNKLLKFKKSKNSVKQRFEAFLKKFPNIVKVNLMIEDESEVLSLIGQYCPHIRSLKYRKIKTILRDDEEFEFFRMYGHKLEELYLYGEFEAFTEFLIFCPNIKTIYIGDIEPSLVSNTENYSLINEVIEFLPKLQRIESKFSIRHSENVQKFMLLSVKY